MRNLAPTTTTTRLMGFVERVRRLCSFPREVYFCVTVEYFSFLFKDRVFCLLFLLDKFSGGLIEGRASLLIKITGMSLTQAMGNQIYFPGRYLALKLVPGGAHYPVM
jgi:hypothetical protein